MELRAPHMLSALDPSDPSTVLVWCTEQALYKHFLSKNLRGGGPNPAVVRTVYTPLAGYRIPLCAYEYAFYLRLSAAVSDLLFWWA